MRKNEFHDSAKRTDKESAGDQASTTAPVVAQPRPAITTLRPPAPKAPFGLHVLPTAIHTKPVSAKIVTQAEETAGETK